MNYIIFDLELNSKPFKNRHPNEIIEIGAVKLNDSLELINTFQAFVRPKIYRRLFPVVKRKTGIAQPDINDAEDFRKVIREFKEWIDDEYILCSWGHDDIHHLKSNCEFNHLGTSWIKKNIDIQKQFSRIFNLPLGQSASLKNALAMLEIPVNEDLHRADVDAKYTADVFIRIFNQVDFMN